MATKTVAKRATKAAAKRPAAKKAKEVVEAKPIALKINFSNIASKDLDGKDMNFNISKSLGNHIYKTTGELGELDLAMRIYKGGVVELSEQEKSVIERVMQGPQCPFVAFVKKAVLDSSS